MDVLPEPWLRGAIAGVNPLTAPILFTFQQAREDLTRWTNGLTSEQIWSTPHGFGSVGFHLRHIAGSAGRLMTYLQGGALTPEQLAALEAEHLPAGAGCGELLALVDAAFRDAETVVRAIEPSALAERRTVGRKDLPTTV